MKLIAYRGLVAAGLAVLLMLWMEPSFYPESHRVIWFAAGVYALLLLLQAGLQTLNRLPETLLLLFEFTSDLGIAGMLIYATGGISSPFSFLLGLIVLASGTLGRILLPIAISVIGCIVYLITIYTAASSQHLPLASGDALHALLQISAILLVGSVMAFIARRYVGLRKTSDQAVRQHKRLKGLHSRVMSAMREGVMVLDDRLGLQDMNAAARELLTDGHESDEQALLRLLAEMPELKNWFGRKETTPDYHGEYQCGERRLLVSARELGVDGGQDDEHAWLVTLVDISDLRRLEAQLIEQEKMAALGQMSAMLAHEIRNPIQTMAQGLELMSMHEGRQQEVQAILHDEMLRLNRLVGMMLDYSKPLHASPCLVEMHALLEQAVYQVDMEGKHVEWHSEIDKLCIDPDHFRLVLDNLLSNAMQNRADQHRVEVDLYRRDAQWVLTVCNRGSIAESLRKKLFQPFVSGRSTGVGLGLSTVKQVCDANGWKVAVEEAGGRVCFEVSAPWDARTLAGGDVHG